MAARLPTREATMAWHEEHGSSVPNVGDIAPDFELHDVRGEASVRLSSFQGDRPVALIFGSFT